MGTNSWGIELWVSNIVGKINHVRGFLALCDFKKSI